MENITPHALRQRIRQGKHRTPTSGWCDDFLQGNLVILPHALAKDFEAFCMANSAPLPLLGRGKTGDPMLPDLGEDIDIRTDVPGYCVFTQGQHSNDVDDLNALWRDDLVSFVLGCSFSFEAELLEAGVPIRHQSVGRNVPMYRTQHCTHSVGPFGGALVVSMRAMPPEQIDTVRSICERHPMAHGAPIHIGEASELGIENIHAPQWGDAPVIEPGDITVFWACGVTGQEAVRTARPDIAITHRPGHMLVTDLPARPG